MALVSPMSVPQPAHARTTKPPPPRRNANHHQPAPHAPQPTHPSAPYPTPANRPGRRTNELTPHPPRRCGTSPQIRPLPNQPASDSTHRLHHPRRLLRPATTPTHPPIQRPTTPPTHRTPRPLAADRLRLHNRKPQPQTRHPNRRRPQHTLKATRMPGGRTRERTGTTPDWMWCPPKTHPRSSISRSATPPKHSATA